MSLGVTTQATKVSGARRVLQHHAAIHACVGELLEASELLRTPHGFEPARADEFEDALRVLDALHGAGEDQIVRVLSVRLFHDSKRIKALARQLDVLTSESLEAPSRERAEVFAEIGLVKEPLPMLFAGHGEITLERGGGVRIAKPYVGLASNAICAYVGDPRWVLSVENLTTFHHAAKAFGGDHAGLVVGGMPSPSSRQAYQCVLDRVDPSVPI
ncbi:MAG: hypothetical protein ABIU96_07775 [Rhodanobacter sp.]